MTTAVVAPPLPEAPYRGIQPFRFIDQQIFAAREEETWTLLSNVTLYRAVLLYGDSGTGKSSLVNAGLLPQAIKENYLPDRLRVQPFAGREIKVERIRMSGPEDPATYLPSNFAAADTDTAAESIELSLADFRARLESFRQAPDEADSGELFRAPRTTPRPLLIFDQFEEFITLFEEAQRVGTSEETRRALEQVPAAQRDILNMLVEFIQDDTLPIKILFAFREDYLAKLSILFDHCPELLDQAQRLLPPAIAQLPQIIRAPFNDPALRAHFLKHSEDGSSEISEPLAQKIAAALGRRSEGDTANLTELQIVCQRLWHARDPEKMFARDGLEGLLKDYGTDVFEHFTPDERTAAIILLSHMITASNTRNIISEDDLMSRSAQFGVDRTQCRAALTALSRSQIVRREPRHSIYFYEITSEYLVPWIKESVARHKSAEERRLAQEAQQKLEEERALAVARLEAEERRGRLLRRLLTAMILLMIAVIILGIVAYRQYRRLAAAEARAQASQEQTEQILNSLKLVTSQNPDESLKGIKQVEELVNDKKLSSDLAFAAIQPALASQDKRVRQAGYDLVLQTAQTNPTVTQTLVQAAQTNDTLAQQLPARFFIHISDESQRAQAQQIAGLLKKKGYLVPKILNVGDKGVKSNQLRYFRDSDPGFPAPQEIVTMLNNARAGKWNPRRITGLEQSTKVPPGQFEIWFESVAPVQTEAKVSKGSLSLNLIDAEDGKQVGANARLTLRNLSKGQGETTLSGTNVNLDEGDYEVSVTVPGYKSANRKFSIKSGQPSTVSLRLIREKSGYGPEQGPYNPKKPNEQLRQYTKP
ncbi:MAG: hypothetical protein ABI596_09925 [Pyrinomonadaceae bacterium]